MHGPTCHMRAEVHEVCAASKSEAWLTRAHTSGPPGDRTSVLACLPVSLPVRSSWSVHAVSHVCKLGADWRSSGFPQLHDASMLHRNCLVRKHPEASKPADIVSVHLIAAPSPEEWHSLWSDRPAVCVSRPAACVARRSVPAWASTLPEIHLLHAAIGEVTPATRTERATT